jgi:hypothetical protein
MGRLGGLYQYRRAGDGVLRRLICGAVTACVLATGLVEAAGASSGSGPSYRPEDNPGIARAVAEEQAKREEAQRRRAMPEERERRQRSRTAFRALSAQEAVLLARQTPAARRLVEVAWRPLSGLAERGHRVREYLSGETVARMVTPEGDEYLVDSTLPLRVEAADGGLRRADLALVSRGGAVAPANPLVDVRLGERPSDGARLVDAGVAAVPVGHVDVPAQRLDASVFFADARPTTDYVLRPTPEGFEAQWQLRSIDSPEAFALRLDVPDGATVRPAHAGAPGWEVVDGERRLATISAPKAWDADEQEVPVEGEVTDGVLQMRIAHRDRDVRYPLVLDPSFGDFYKWEVNGYGSSSRWQFQGDANKFGQYFGPGWLGAGLYMRRVAGWGALYFNEWEGANWHYRLAGAQVAGAHFEYYSHEPNGTWLRLALGLPGAHPARETLVTGQVYNQFHRVCFTLNTSTGRCVEQPVSGWDGSRAEFGLIHRVPGWKDGFAAHLGGAEVYVVDYIAPSLINVTAPGGWVKSGTISATAGDAGVGIRHFAIDTPDSSWTGAQHDQPCQAHHQAPCPGSIPLSTNASTLPEGVNTVRFHARDAFPENWAETTRTVRVDRSPPVISEPTGALWDRRNQAADHRNEGLYGATYTARLHATDGTTTSNSTQRSGVKRIDVKVKNAAGTVVINSPDPQPQGCAAGSCDKPRDFTLHTDSLPDGDYTIEVTATDQLDNWTTTPTSWPVTIDRRGDVYRARQYTGDPNQGGAMLADEWMPYATSTARRLEDDVVSTRTVVDCGEGDGSGGRCAETRSVSRFGEDDPAAGEIFTKYRGASEEDARIAEIGELNQIRQDTEGASATGEGQLVDALQSWQRSPPAASASYAIYESRHTVDTTTASDTDSEEQEYPSTEDVTVRLWVDKGTRLPVKEIATVAGEVMAQRFWTYDVGRLERSQLAPNFFEVPRPDRIEQEKTVDYSGNRHLGPQTDPETGRSYQPYDLGDQAVVASTAFCLDTGELSVLREPGPEAITGSAGEFAPDPSGEVMQRVSAYYDLLPRGGTCLPGQGDMSAPALVVRSADRQSSLAAAWRRTYMDIGESVQTDPMHEDFLRAGVATLFGADTSPLAYVATIDDDETVGVYLEKGETAVVVTGPFDKNDVSSLAYELEAQ